MICTYTGLLYQTSWIRGTNRFSSPLNHRRAKTPNRSQPLSSRRFLEAAFVPSLPVSSYSSVPVDNLYLTKRKDCSPLSFSCCIIPPLWCRGIIDIKKSGGSSRPVCTVIVMHWLANPVNPWTCPGPSFEYWTNDIRANMRLIDL